MATTYYVSNTSPVGNDANAGTSTATAFLTLSKGASVLVPGDTCRVIGGNYQGGFYINSGSMANGTSASPITMMSDVRWTLSSTGHAIIKPLSATPAGSGNHAAFEVRRNSWIIDGFEVDGTNGYGSADQATSSTWAIGGTDWWIGIYSTGRNNIIRNCHVHYIARTTSAVSNGGSGIESEWFYDSAGPHTILNNYVHHIGNGIGDDHIHGVYVACQKTTVQGNIIHNANGDDITSWHGATNLVISNNICFNPIKGACILIGSGDAGAAAGGVVSSRIFNNICLDANFGIIENGTIGAGNLYSNNNVTSCTTAWSLLASTHTSDVAGSPLFVNYIRTGGGDYHFSLGSACINSGLISLSGASAPVTDFDGTGRPINLLMDLGAYEFTAGGGGGGTSGDGFASKPNFRLHGKRSLRYR